MGVDGWGMSLRGMMSLVVVFGFGICINLVEVTWKSKLKAQFPNPNDYSAFMGDFSAATGTVTFIMMLASRFIFKKYGWGVAALITPVVLAATGVGFFLLVLNGTALEPSLAMLGLTPLMAAVLVGAAQNVFSKSSKYALFNPCKEMAYIPLDSETKVKGKAAIDVVCNPMGKSGGALIQQFMIIGFGSLAASTPYLGVILLLFIVMWINAARSLDGQFSALTKSQIADDAQDKGIATEDVDVKSSLDGDGFIEGEVKDKNEQANPPAKPPLIPRASSRRGGALSTPPPPLASSPRGLSRSEGNPSAKLVWFLAAAGAFLSGSNLPLSRHSALYYRLLQ